MRRIFHLTTLLLLLGSCHQPTETKRESNTTKFYSKTVNDTFTISVSLPSEYDSNKATEYPVVYLLDANFYFDMVAAMYKKYAEGGLLPPVILVGIGYKDLETMDSLRNRDYSFPVSIAEYEMSQSGKADLFLSFITNELIPEIENNYPADKYNRILMGHSLGGYFTMYTLQQCLATKDSIFKSYIAASPSTHYNHNYILNELDKLNADNQQKNNLYVTFGGLEDEEEEDSTMLKTDQVLLSLTKSLKENCKVNYKGESYSNLGHMDTPLPTFVKGLMWALIAQPTNNKP